MNWLKVDILFLSFLFLPLFGTKAQAPQKNFLDLNYSGEDKELQALDIYSFENTESLKPVVVYFHGGGWSIGDKSRKVKDKISLFQKLGYVFVSAN